MGPFKIHNKYRGVIYVKGRGQYQKASPCGPSVPGQGEP